MWWIVVAGGLVLGLTGCTSHDALTVDDFQEKVIAILQGDQTTLPDFERSVEVTLEAMYCAEYACTIPYEMEYLHQVAQQEDEYLTLFHYRICKKIKAPRSLSKDVTRLCTELQQLQKNIQDLGKNAKLARDFLARVGNTINAKENQQALKNLNQRLFDSRDNIKRSVEKIKEIKWLATIFTPQS